MPQRVRRNPRLMDAGAAARSRKQFREGRVAQRLGSTLATTADEKHEWAADIHWSVRDHILVEGGEGPRLVEIDDALKSRLCPHALRMIVAASDEVLCDATGGALSRGGETAGTRRYGRA